MEDVLQVYPLEWPCMVVLGKPITTTYVSDSQERSAHEAYTNFARDQERDQPSAT